MKPERELVDAAERQARRWVERAAKAEGCEPNVLRIAYAEMLERGSGVLEYAFIRSLAAAIVLAKVHQASELRDRAAELDAMADEVMAEVGVSSLRAPQDGEVWWLIERSRPEGRANPEWRVHDNVWTRDANEASKHPTRDDAEKALTRMSGELGIPVHRIGHVAEHMWSLRAPQSGPWEAKNF